MIKYVVKRDGSIQEFNASKLNNWISWASEKTKGSVDWTGVVLRAVSTLPETVTSQELQERLIKECLDRKTWSYNLMAGRLYAPLNVKIIHGGKYPTVKELHKKLKVIGQMVDFGATDDDYEWAEEVIDHSKTATLPYFQQHYIIHKYALKDRVTGTVYETPQFVFMRMALELSVHESNVDKRRNHIKKFYTYLSDGKLNAPTPNYTNLGTKLRGFASCNLMTTKDSAASLAAHDHIAYTMTYMSAGIGSHINSRSIGDSVRSGQIAHLGKLPLYRSLSYAVKAMTQNSRGGSATTYYSCFDPEVETIMRLKNPMSTEDKKIRGLDYAMQSNELFAKKVAKNEDIFLFNSFTAPDLYDAFYSGDEDHFEELYNKYEQDPNFTKKYVNAREIVLTVGEESFSTGRAYEHFPAEANRHTPHKDTIYSSNLCVAPETLILTDRGYEVISDLEGEVVNVWNGKEFSETVVRKTGENQKLITVKTNAGYELTCTPYHKFYTAVRGTTTRVVEKRANELTAGDKLIKCDFPIIVGYDTLDNAYANGFYSGDGCLTKNGKRIYLYGEKRKLKQYLGDIFKTWYIQDKQDREYGESDLLKDKLFVPSNSYTVGSRISWFEGLCDSDGTVARNGETQSLQIGSVDKRFLQEVQLMLQTLGVSSKVTKAQSEGERLMPLNDGSGELGMFFCKESYRLLIGQTGINNLQALGFNPKRLIITNHTPNRECSHFVKIVSIEDNGRFDDTYCFTEPKRNLGVFNGMLTGQCLEINEPTAGYDTTADLYQVDHERGEVALCSLAAICVDKITSEAEYEDVMYYALLMIDRCIHLSHYELPHIGYTAKNRLNAGVGIIGLAHYLAKNKLKYSSQEGKDEIHRLAEKHAYYAIKGSLRLGKELGNAPWMHKTKWPEGWLPIDTYNKNVDNVVSVSNQYDWESLRKDIIENGGIRTSSLMAHMPAESSSKASGTTNGVYPVRDLDLKKSDGTIITYWSAPDSDKIGKHYEIAWDIPWKDMVDVYAIIQKWTDQGISADFWEDVSGDTKVGSSDIIKQYLYRRKMGLKSKYYQNSKTSNIDTKQDETDVDSSGCSGGGCTL